MQIAHADEVIRVDPGTSPNYSTGNPLQKLLGLVQRLPLAAEREHYWPASLQHLIPFERLELYGPNSPNTDVLDPRQQDDKQDFQKQNLRDFDAGDTTVTRGWVTAGDWTGPFLHLSYRGGPDSQLSQLASGQLGETIKLWLQVGDAAVPEPVPAPYNETSDRYEVEFWGYGSDHQALRQQLDRGELRLAPNLVPGSPQEFAREAIAGQDLRQVAPANAITPSCRCIWRLPGPMLASRFGTTATGKTTSTRSTWSCAAGIAFSKRARPTTRTAASARWSFATCYRITSHSPIPRPSSARCPGGVWMPLAAKGSRARASARNPFSQSTLWTCTPYSPIAALACTATGTTRKFFSCWPGVA